jgi:aminopeptidase N
MFSNLIILLISICAVFASIPPKRLEKRLESDIYNVESLKITPFFDPIDGISYRLPHNIEPLHYDLTLMTNIHRGDLEFSGEVKINFHVKEQTSVIKLHHRFLTIQSATILNQNGAVFASNPLMSYDDQREFLSFTTSRFPMSANSNYTLVINYIGTLRDDQAGFYYSSYIDTNLEVKKWLAVTQFEATDARHAFPCFDEPRFRTTFSISIKHHNTYHAISNMPIIENVTELNDYITTKFDITPSMPTYLVGFVISDYRHVYERFYRAPQQVFAKPQSIDNGEAKLAIDVSGRIMNQLEEYFGQRYRYLLPKLDQVAVPDFAGGAMENW